MNRSTTIKQTCVCLLTVAGIVMASGRDGKADCIFGTPINLGPTVNGLYDDTGPCVSSDGLSLFFASDRPGGSGGYDIWVAMRATVSDPWMTPENLGPMVNSANNDYEPRISSDGLELYLVSWRSGGYGNEDIWVAMRTTASDSWGEPANLGPSVNGYYLDGGPSITADGLTLFLHSNRPGRYAVAGSDLWMTTRESRYDDWNEVENLGPVVNSPDNDGQSFPCISTDGLKLFFVSNREGGSGYNDIWMTARSSPSAPWNTPVNIGPPVNSASRDNGPFISGDECTLFFYDWGPGSGRPDGYGRGDLWEVSITRIIDFTGDDRVNLEDFSIFAQHYQVAGSGADIAPTPLGDGNIDAQDTAVFASNWLMGYPRPGPATDPDPNSASVVAPLVSDSNVYVILDYTPGAEAVRHTGYFSDDFNNVNNRVTNACLGSPPWPASSATAFRVGYNHPDIPEFARPPLIRGKTYYWCVDEFDGDTTYPGEIWSFVVMPIEAWGPNPADGQTNTDTNLTLSWNLGGLNTEGQVVHYDVYIGTDETDVEDANTVSPEYVNTVGLTRFGVADLEAGTEYFWRIDTMMMLICPPFTVHIVTGNIWSFTTTSSDGN